LRSLRYLPFLSICFLLASCSEKPKVAADPTKEPWYAETTQKLTAMMRDANALYKDGKADDAAALIEQGKPLQDKLVAVQKPTLEATLAAADLDDLYGRMLLANRHYAWARLLFQKNYARFRHLDPQTPETSLRLKAAEDYMDECDKHLTE
jgi:hypothetical protein